jgi:hypothetical protein
MCREGGVSVCVITHTSHRKTDRHRGRRIDTPAYYTHARTHKHTHTHRPRRRAWGALWLGYCWDVLLGQVCVLHWDSFDTLVGLFCCYGGEYCWDRYAYINNSLFDTFVGLF